MNGVKIIFELADGIGMNLLNKLINQSSNPTHPFASLDGFPLVWGISERKNNQKIIIHTCVAPVSSFFGHH